MKLGIGLSTSGTPSTAPEPNPYPDWTYRYDHVIAKEAFPSAQSALPVPIRGTIPDLADVLEVSRADLLDLRIVDSEGNELAWSGTINATTGVYDLWVKRNWSSTADNTLTCYIGNDAADAPTEGVTWPTEWKSLRQGSGFLTDLIDKTAGTRVGDASIVAAGLDTDGSGAAMSDNGLSARMGALGTKDISFLLFGMMRDVSGDTYPLGVCTSSVGYNAMAIECENGQLSLGISNGSAANWLDKNDALTNNVAFTAIGSRYGGNFRGLHNGAEYSYAADNYSLIAENYSSVAALVRLNNKYCNMVTYCLLIVVDDHLTADQSTIFDHLLREPETYNEVGELEVNT